MGHVKWSEIKRRKGVPIERRAFTYTAEPDGDGWLLRVVEVPELVTAAHDLAEADVMVRDLVATWDRIPADSFDVERVD